MTDQYQPCHFCQELCLSCELGQPCQSHPSCWTKNSANPTTNYNELNQGWLLGFELTCPSLAAVDIAIPFIRDDVVDLLGILLKDLQQKGVAVRIITTTYMGVTSPTALDKLAEMTRNDGMQDGNIVVCNTISWTNGFRNTGWRFKHRDGCPGAAIIGSTKLNEAALLSVSESKVRRIPWKQYTEAIRPFEAGFDGFWESARRGGGKAYFYNDQSRERFISELEKR